MTWALEQDLGWDSGTWGQVCSTVFYESRSSFINIIKATAFTFAHALVPPCTHVCTESCFVTHQIHQMHQQQGPRPRQQDHLLGKVQTHLGYCRRKTAGTRTQNVTPGPTHQHTHGCIEQKMNKQMKWTGKKNERSASGKSREYKKYAAQ